MPENRSYRGLVVTGLALFAMFFGAGNLILPAMIGVEAGERSTAALIGFLMTGVLLPVAGMVAMATRHEGENILANRIGTRFGLVFTTLVFLSTGMIYAIPRVAAVSFEFAVAPYTNGRYSLLSYTLIFFAISFLITLRPAAIVERIGGWLTPALLVLLAVLIAASFGLPKINVMPTEDYATAPLAAGVIQGYFTMDAIAALVFGGVIASALQRWGWKGKSSLKGMITAAALAGGLLALVYVGLVRVGNSGEGENGAQVLSEVSYQLFGNGGRILIGGIIVLACLTTVLGLLSAATQYFHELVPAISVKYWLLIQIVVSILLANRGLETILAFVAPLNQLLYPAAICLILLSIFDMLIGYRLNWAYRLGGWVAVIMSVPEALYSTNFSVFEPMRSFLDLFPLGSVQMAWIVPTVGAVLVGIVLDFAFNSKKNDDVTREAAIA